MKLVIALLIFLTIGCSQNKNGSISNDPNDFPVLKGPYLGQKTPGMNPEIFAPGIISTSLPELNSVFSADGSQFFFSRKFRGVYQIFVSKQINDVWTPPEMVYFSKINPELEALDLILSPDEKSLYFISNRPAIPFKDKSVNIWSSKWDGGKWLNPEVSPSPVNTEFDESYPFFVADKSMYFASTRVGGLGDKDVYRAKFNKGLFMNPKCMH